MDALWALDEASRYTLAVARSIRDLDEKLTFRGVVRARCVPIVLASPYVVDRNYTHIAGEFLPSSEGLPSWTQLSLGSRHWREDIIAAVQTWRQALIAELDYVGFTVTLDSNGKPQIAHALQRRRRTGEILAPDGTPGGLRRNQYLLLSEDFLDDLGVYTKFRYLLANYDAIARRERVKPETVFQRFFEENPHLIRRGLFEQAWAKPKLRLPESPGHHFSPDFVLKPNVAAHVGTNWEILDLKLPDDPLVTSRQFHPSYAAKLTKAMQQLRNYRNYFSRTDDEVRRELVTRFGYQPVHPRIAVLIGRRDREEGLDRVQGDAQDLDIDVITYDDIVDFEANRLVLQGTIAGLFSD